LAITIRSFGDETTVDLFRECIGILAKRRITADTVL